MDARRSLIGAAALAIGVVAGRWTSAPAARPPVVASSTVTPAPGAPRLLAAAPAFDRAALRAEVRAAVADSLAELQPPSEAAAEVAAPADPREPPSEPTAAQLAADDEARHLVDRAIALGSWTAADWDHLHELMPSMTADQRLESLRQLSVATNQQALRLAPPR